MLFAFNGRATRNFLVILCLMNFVLFVDRVNLAAAAVVIQRDLGLTNIGLGLAFAACDAIDTLREAGGWILATTGRS